MSRSRKPWRAYGRYGSIGIELVLSIGLGYYGGHWLDGRWNTKGWLAGLGFLMGCYAGFKALWTAAKRMERDVADDEAQERGEDPWDHDTGASDDETSAEPPPAQDEKPSDAEHPSRPPGK
jgi:F0F1-type ATP synthase assembly protein I